jgi:hypothetical protein
VSGRRRRSGERGSALLLVLILVVAALGIAGALVLSSETASRAAAARFDETRAYWAAQSALQASLDALAGLAASGAEGPEGVDGRTDSLRSIVRRSGPPSDIRAAPDGSFTARATRRGAGPNGPCFFVEAYGKWGGAVRGLQALAEPQAGRPFRGAIFADRAASLAGRGIVDAWDGAAGPYDPGRALPGLDLIASNGEISIGSSAASARNGEGLGGGERGGAAGASFIPLALYAPRADVQVHMVGGGGRDEALPEAGAKIVVRGNVVPGPGAAVTLAGPVEIEGSTAPSDRTLALAPLAFEAPGGPRERLVVAKDERRLLAGGTLTAEGVSVAGALVVQGPVELYCLGDFAVEAGGSIEVARGGSLHVLGTGGLRVAPGGLLNAGAARDLFFELSTDSTADPAKRADLFVAGVAGALVGRTVRVTGTAIAIHHDVSLAGLAARTRPLYRARGVVEAAPPW